MSSVIDAGYYANEASRQMKEQCPARKLGKKHKVKIKQPYVYKCKFCKERFYLK